MWIYTVNNLHKFIIFSLTKTLKQLHFTTCNCGNETISHGGQNEYKEDVIPQILQNWMEATDKFQQTMHKIEHRVKNDFKKMSEQIVE